MSQERDGTIESDSSKIEKADKIFKSVERFFILIGVAIVLLMICWRLAESTSYGSTILFLGLCLIGVLILIEVLHIERNRHK